MTELEPITKAIQDLVDKYKIKEGFSVKVQDGKVRTFIDMDELYSSAIPDWFKEKYPNWATGWWISDSLSQICQPPAEPDR